MILLRQLEYAHMSHICIGDMYLTFVLRLIVNLYYGICTFQSSIDV
jgi:hypothetical protein